MEPKDPVVVVGASIAGVRTAQALRSLGYDGAIVIVEAELDAPCDKPPLSKGFLTGSLGAESMQLLTPEQAKRDDIRMILGRRAVGVDLTERTLRLDDDQVLQYDRLVIATGARAKPSPWGELPGLHVLRTLGDAVALRESVSRGGDMVVIGAGFVGLEVASSVRSLGVPVTVVDPAPTPLGRALTADLGQRIADLHRRNGVVLRLGVGVAGVEARDSQIRVRLDDGHHVDASTVLAAIGSAPDDGWVRESRLETDDGLVCDEHGRSLTDSRVYAVGDVARWRDAVSGELVRMEHWTAAVNQARDVAHHIVDPDTPAPRRPAPYVWSDQHDWKLQTVGRTTGVEREMVIDGPLGDQFAALYADGDGALAGAVTVNWPRATLLARTALNRKESADESSDAIRSLLRR